MDGVGIIVDMRLTEFHQLIQDEFGHGQGNWILHSHVPAGYDRTVEQLIEDGLSLRKLWAVLCDDFDVPEERRLGVDRGEK
ncbi:hypothetical protein A605_08480 [Corynebacterium halotolerans YIM 70093 = DSM 44683]|uniref:DUF3046 domain-containing protein n=2 Tax=Corynebacterium halotolerans TaxID=225326 RepID=M1NMV0_9CORY|nr:hypothetical protein A605_08480 [Corynebacterium halotolerans YIM 70093 = DSM 44683]